MQSPPKDISPQVRTRESRDTGSAERIFIPFVISKSPNSTPFCSSFSPKRDTIPLASSSRTATTKTRAFRPQAELNLPIHERLSEKLRPPNAALGIRRGTEFAVESGGKQHKQADRQRGCTVMGKCKQKCGFPFAKAEHTAANRSRNKNRACKVCKCGKRTPQFIVQLLLL